MIYFMVCGSEATGWDACHARGWTQVGVDRFYTPERDDVRVVRRFTDIALLPGGTYMMAAPDFAKNAERGRFEHLVEIGRARWVTGEEPKAEAAVLTPVDPPVETLSYEIPAAPFNPPLPPSTRDNWPPRTTDRPGGSRGRRLSRR